MKITDFPRRRILRLCVNVSSGSFFSFCVVERAENAPFDVACPVPTIKTKVEMLSVDFCLFGTSLISILRRRASREVRRPTSDRLPVPSCPPFGSLLAPAAPLWLPSVGAQGFTSHRQLSRRPAVRRPPSRRPTFDVSQSAVPMSDVQRLTSRQSAVPMFDVSQSAVPTADV